MGITSRYRWVFLVKQFIYYSRLKSVFYLLLALAMVVLSFYGLQSTEAKLALSGFALLLLGITVMAFSVWRIFDSRPILTLDDCCFNFRRLNGVESIPWREIAAVFTYELSNQKFLTIAFVDLGAFLERTYLGKLPWTWRWKLALDRQTDRIDIPLNWLDVNASELCNLIQKRLLTETPNTSLGEALPLPRHIIQ